MKKLHLILIGLFTSFLSFSQDLNYEVYAIKYASLAPNAPASKIASQDSLNIDFMIWLIKGNNGKNILLDAGFLYGIEEPKDFNGINFLRPDSTLPQLTIRPEEISDIILSHQHWDHIDCKTLFPNAQVYIQKDDYNYVTRMSWQKGGVNAEFNKRTVRELIDLNTAGRVTLVEGDNREIIPGIKVYNGSAQSTKSQYVLVKTSAENTVLASDNVWLYYNLNRATPAPFYGMYDASSYMKVLQKVKTLVSDDIPPTNDSAMFSKFPVATEGVFKIK
jgi:glyoxylase-like metal-dependent hydrolase (beta-lactamase superfamily II)